MHLRRRDLRRPTVPPSTRMVRRRTRSSTTRPACWPTTLDAMFDADVDLTGVACAGVIDADLRPRCRPCWWSTSWSIARHGYQFERFEDAWCAWADAEAAIDWTEEQPAGDRRRAAPAGGHVRRPATTRCSAAARPRPGRPSAPRSGSGWTTNIAAGRPLDGFTDFDPPTPALCPDLAFAPGAAEAIAEAIRNC